MTAANLICRPEAAYLLTDAAGYYANGEVAQLASKVIISRKHRLAIATSGMMIVGFRKSLSAWIERRASQADLLHQIEDQWSDVEQGLLEVCDQYGEGQPFQGYVAIWNDLRDAAETYVIAGCNNTFGPDYTPYRLVGVAEVFSPVTDAAVQSAARADPVACGASLLAAQRAAQDASGVHRVGGWGEVVSVARDRIASQRIIEWPDRPGSRIRQDGQPI